MPYKLICGTSSKWRQAILRKAGYELISVVAADIDEKAIRDPDPLNMPVLIAHAKADAIIIEKKLNDIGEGVLMTCDQITLYNDTEVREKPETEEIARRFLRSYSGHKVSTGMNTCY